jgi:cation:H+ antiporter
MTIDFLFAAGGFLLLFLGGEALVRGSIQIAERLGLSKLFIGLIIVGFGTSAPELLVSVNAALGGTPDIAVGNVVGSNIANVLLIIGVAAAILPISGWQSAATREALIAGVAALVFYGLVQGQIIGPIEGAFMLAVLSIYLGSTYWLERRKPAATIYEKESEKFEGMPIHRAWLAPTYALSGIALLVVGADFLVDGSTSIARRFGVPDAIIGLSLVALGTSLPELATAIVAAIRKHSDVVLGNVIGSSIFNIFAILGATAVIHPIEISERFRGFDTYVMLGTSGFLILLLFALKRIGRGIGLLMLLGYAGYMALLFTSGV